MKKLILIPAALLPLALNISAQTYSIDWFSTESAATSTGDGYTLNASMGSMDGTSMSGNGYTLDTGFGGVAADFPTTVAIFDGSNASFNGVEPATMNNWLASKFCIRQQSYKLDSVILLLSSQNYSGTPAASTLRLQLFTTDPLADKPYVSTGVTFQLSGLSNPVTLPVGDVEVPVKWVPTTPFILEPNTCYWPVLSVDDGAAVWQTASFSQPEGDAAAFGRSSSPDAGAAWSLSDPASNRKMIVRGFPLPSPVPLVISAIEVIGADLRLSFNSVLGKHYRIESSPDPTTGWTMLPDTQSDGVDGTLQVTIPNALGFPQQFYRVEELP